MGTVKGGGEVLQSYSYKSQSKNCFKEPKSLCVLCVQLFYHPD